MATRTILEDDLDGTVSSDETPVLKWAFAFGPSNAMTTYNIDLTAENFDRLKEALAEFTEKAEEVQGRSSTRSSSTPAASTGGGSRLSGEASAKYKAAVDEFNASKKEQRSDIASWAKGSKEFKSANVGDKGVIKADLLSAYYEANPEQRHYFGADAVAAPSREDFLTS